MSDVFLERTFDPAFTPDDVFAAARGSSECFLARRVDWNQSFLATDGSKMICWFQGPDTESVREALRQVGADTAVVWPGTVHDPPGADAPSPDEANVLVTRSFAEPVTLDEIQAIEDAGAWCLETHRVKFARTFFSLDRKRMICLYKAPDAESVRLAQRQAEMPLDAVWAYRIVRPSGAA